MEQTSSIVTEASPSVSRIVVGRRRRGAAAWAELVAEQAGSGLSVAEYCRRRGLRPVSFYAWRRRLARDSPKSSLPARRAAVAEPGFVRLEAAISNGSQIRVDFPCGASLHAPAGHLAELVGLLLREGRSC